MLDLLRTAVAIPLGLIDLAWCWLTRDERERDIAEQQRRFQDMAEGQ